MSQRLSDPELADDGWSGDRYAIFEEAPNGRTLLVIRLRLAGEAEAARFFGGYSELLEKKHENRTSIVRRPNSLSFETSGGGVFLRCSGRDCLMADGATRAQFEAMTRSIGWPAVRAGLRWTPPEAEMAWLPGVPEGAVSGIRQSNLSANSLPAQ